MSDLDVFSQDRYVGSNTCTGNNGGCQDLCLFNGDDPVCACSYGKLSADNKTCENYDAFLMYSRVSRIETIHMFNESDPNLSLIHI